MHSVSVSVHSVGWVWIGLCDNASAFVLTCPGRYCRCKDVSPAPVVPSPTLLAFQGDVVC